MKRRNSPATAMAPLRARLKYRSPDAAQATRAQTPSARALGTAAPAIAAAARRHPHYQYCTACGCVGALDARDRIAVARAARSLARQGARLPGIGADGPADRRAAAVVADLVGAVAGGRRFSAVETLAGVHRGSVPDALGRLRDERLCRSPSRSAGAAHGRAAARRGSREATR